MAPLPVEATFFAETYRSETTSAGVGLFTVDPPSRSLFHRLAFDEVWHFYAGDQLRLVLLHPDGTDSEVIMGSGVAAGQRVQFVVPAGVWQAGEVVPGGRWSLYGCTIAPGFTPDCFEGGRVADLLRSHPGRAVDIERLGIADGETSMPVPSRARDPSSTPRARRPASGDRSGDEVASRRAPNDANAHAS